MADHKLNIFEVLSAIDRKDVDFLTNLPPEEQKLFVPVVTIRWLTGTKNKQQVFLINEVVNPYIFALHKHPKLLFNLMTICTTGKPQRYKYIKSNARTSTTPVSINVIQQYFGYSSKEAGKSLGILSSSDLVEMAEEMGWQDVELNKLKTELGIPTKKSKKISKVSTKEFEFLDE